MAGTDGGLQQHGAACGAGGDVGASLPEPGQCFAVAEREGRFQAAAVMEFGQVKNSIDQAGAASRSQVPGCGAQRRPGGSHGLPRDGYLGRCDRAVIVADLDMPVKIMFLHAVPPALGFWC